MWLRLDARPAASSLNRITLPGILSVKRRKKLQSPLKRSLRLKNTPASQIWKTMSCNFSHISIPEGISRTNAEDSPSSQLPSASPQGCAIVSYLFWNKRGLGVLLLLLPVHRVSSSTSLSVQGCVFWLQIKASNSFPGLLWHALCWKETSPSALIVPGQRQTFGRGMTLSGKGRRDSGKLNTDSLLKYNNYET